MRFTPGHYLKAAPERMEQARRIYEGGNYAVAIYLAGVAVECVLRAYRTREDPSFDERHDLYDLMKASGILALTETDRQRELTAHLGDVWSRWKNDYRYASEERLQAEYRRLKLNRGIVGNQLKENARIVLNAVFEIVTMGARLWNSRKN